MRDRRNITVRVAQRLFSSFQEIKFGIWGEWRRPSRLVFGGACRILQIILNTVWHELALTDAIAANEVERRSEPDGLDYARARKNS
jgi:hypothetical protein